MQAWAAASTTRLTTATTSNHCTGFVQAGAGRHHVVDDDDAPPADRSLAGEGAAQVGLARTAAERGLGRRVAHPPHTVGPFSARPAQA